MVRANGVAPDQRTIEAAWGAAAFALPGAIAALTALPAPHGAIVGEAVIASAFVAVAGTLTVAAIAQVALRRPVPLLVGGAAASALVTAIVADRVRMSWPQRTPSSRSCCSRAALLLLLAPVLNTGFGSFGIGGWRLADLEGEEIAAAAVTCASIVALARVAALVAPGASLVIVAALVVALAAGTRSLSGILATRPGFRWRRGRRDRPAHRRLRRVRRRHHRDPAEPPDLERAAVRLVDAAGRTYRLAGARIRRRRSR